MPRLALGFHLHLPHRLRPFSYFDIGRRLDYRDDAVTRAVLAQTLAMHWRPALDALEAGVADPDGGFCFYLALSGTLLDQLAAWAPEELDRLRRLAGGGKVEFVVTPAPQSLAALHAPLAEFIGQTVAQRARLQALFGVASCAFRNTGLLYNDALARSLHESGFRAVLAPGSARLFGWRKARRPFAAAPCPALRVLPCDLSLAARFNAHQPGAAKSPLENILELLSRAAGQSEGFCLDLPLASFGGQGIGDRSGFDFLRAIVSAVPARTPFGWALPSELAASPVVAAVSAPETISAASPVGDASPWIGNDIQRDAFDSLYALEARVNESRDPALKSAWRMLQDAGYLRAMDSSTAQPGATPAGDSPYDAYVSFMNILADIESRV